MIIAMDYDDTFSKDPDGWAHVARAMAGRGHKIIGCTMRYPDETDGMSTLYGEVCEQVHFSSRVAKRDYLASKGVVPDVWIDDRPDFIVSSARDLRQEQEEFERMEKSQSEASREYTRGKLTI